MYRKTVFRWTNENYRTFSLNKSDNLRMCIARFNFKTLMLGNLSFIFRNAIKVSISTKSPNVTNTALHSNSSLSGLIQVQFVEYVFIISLLFLNYNIFFIFWKTHCIIHLCRELLLRQRISIKFFEMIARSKTPISHKRDIHHHYCPNSQLVI